MKGDDKNNLVYFYERELTYLRKMGLEFARKYPKIASRLELTADQAADPYVERLLEGFAYLSARVQYNIEAEFPEITSAFLDNLYPHYLQPIPSMSIAKFEVDPKRGKIQSGFSVPKHSPLFAPTNTDGICKFRTTTDLTLYPVTVKQAVIEPIDKYDFLDSSSQTVAVLRLSLESQQGPFSELDLKKLRFYLNGDKSVVHMLYELLFSQTTDVLLLSDTMKVPISLGANSIQSVGFNPDEECIPYPKHSHPQYRLLQEYFVFPEKFLFFDIVNLDKRKAEDQLDLLFLLKYVPQNQLRVSKDNFELGCVPVINLFHKTSEPIRLTQTELEYNLTADIRREHTTEIHSIDKISASSDSMNESVDYNQFYSFSHQQESDSNKAYWIARRIPVEKKNMQGTEMMLSFVDLQFNPKLPADSTIFAHTLCTNRHAADQMPYGAVLFTEDSIPVSKIYCVQKPTNQIDPPIAGTTRWRLISHLSLNYLSLSEGENSVKSLREILGLYNYGDEPAIQQQIMGLRDMKTRKVVRRLGKDSWRGFAQGTEVSLTFDEERFVGGSAFLMASVLNKFFALYASINSFTELIAKSTQREGVWKKWKPMVGAKELL